MINVGIIMSTRRIAYLSISFLPGILGGAADRALARR